MATDSCLVMMMTTKTRSFADTAMAVVMAVVMATVIGIVMAMVVVMVMVVVMGMGRVMVMVIVMAVVVMVVKMVMWKGYGSAHTPRAADFYKFPATQKVFCSRANAPARPPKKQYTC